MRSWRRPRRFASQRRRMPRRLCRRPASASRWRRTAPSASSIRICSRRGARPARRSLPFSPLADEPPPEGADCCWLPGGYPELHADALAAADRFKSGSARALPQTRPVHGECGGYMVLGRKPRRCRRPAPRHDRIARPHDKLRQAQTASRLPQRAALVRQRSRHGKARPCAATNSIMPRWLRPAATSLSPNSPTAKAARSGRPAAGAAASAARFFHAIACQLRRSAFQQRHGADAAVAADADDGAAAGRHARRVLSPPDSRCARRSRQTDDRARRCRRSGSSARRGNRPKVFSIAGFGANEVFILQRLDMAGDLRGERLVDFPQRDVVVVQSVAAPTAAEWR